MTVLLALFIGFIIGFIIGVIVSALVAGASRLEESRQQEIEARLVGEDPATRPKPEERAILHWPVIETSHSWEDE